MGKRIGNFHKINIFTIVVLIVVILFATSVIYTSMKDNLLLTAVQNEEVHTIALGAWTQGFWDNTEKKLYPEKMIELENKLNKKFAIAHYYRGWHELEEPSVVTQLETINANNWTPMLSVNPYYFDDCKPDGQTLYKTIADGKCDEFLRRVANNLSDYKNPFFLRFAWEMNIPNVEWSIVYTGSQPADFQNAWRRIHKIISAENPNILWVFCPNVHITDTPRYASYYPGDEYVDWIGLDGYNWGNTQSWSGWQTFDQIFLESYHELSAIAPEKPFMIAEVNSAANPGDKAEWYTDMLTTLPEKYPLVKALVIFDENKLVQEDVDWSIAISPESFEAFKKGIQNPTYTSSLKLD